MAKVTNAFDTYTATSDREDLSNVIYNISPMETPMVSLGGKRSVKNVQFDWQTESLQAATSTGVLEGNEISRAASTATVRAANVCQINTRNATVTGSQQASDPAAKKSEMAHQMSVIGRALKRDVEKTICGQQGRNNGAAATVRATRGFESWITTNAGRATSGTAGANAANESSAPTDGTQRAFTETILKGVLSTCFGNGASPSVMIVGAFNKQAVSAFSGRASATQAVALEGIPGDHVQAAVSVYTSDFGDIKVVPSNFSRARSALLVDPEYVGVAYLRAFETQDLGAIGDAETKAIYTEFGLEMKNEAANGVVADLTTS